jgi:hypothetical protein
MALIIDFLPIIFSGRKPEFNPDYTQVVFQDPEDTPVVYIEFVGVLMKDNRGKGLRIVEEPVLNAIWALQVFKYNGWEVEIFSLGAEVSIIMKWISRYAPGLVNRIKECCLEEIIKEEKLTDHSLMDVFASGCKEYWFEKEVNWVEIMTTLNKMGFLRKGLLPLEKGERKSDMVALLKEKVFEDLVSDLKTKKNKSGETRGELIKLIESYVKHLEMVGMECDLLVRAKAEGGLLESVLRLLERDQFDPLGCIILAQQDREIQVDKVSSLLEVDVD